MSLACMYVRFHLLADGDVPFDALRRQKPPPGPPQIAGPIAARAPTDCGPVTRLSRPRRLFLSRPPYDIHARPEHENAFLPPLCSGGRPNPRQPLPPVREREAWARVEGLLGASSVVDNGVERLLGRRVGVASASSPGPCSLDSPLTSIAPQVHGRPRREVGKGAFSPHHQIPIY